VKWILGDGELARHLLFADGLLKINGVLLVRQEHEFEQKSNNDVIGAPACGCFSFDI
jgi:hypothetical protein